MHGNGAEPRPFPCEEAARWEVGGRVGGEGKTSQSAPGASSGWGSTSELLDSGRGTTALQGARL